MTGDEINEKVKRSGLTQEEFAKKIGKSPRTLQNYIYGHSAPKVDVLRKIQAVPDKVGMQNISHEYTVEELEILDRKFQGITEDDIITYLKVKKSTLMDRVRFRKFIDSIAKERLNEIIERGL